jgi:hypothetical protein
VREQLKRLKARQPQPDFWLEEEHDGVGASAEERLLAKTWLAAGTTAGPLGFEPPLSDQALELLGVTEDIRSRRGLSLT